MFVNKYIEKYRNILFSFPLYILHVVTYNKPKIIDRTLQKQLHKGLGAPLGPGAVVAALSGAQKKAEPISRLRSPEWRLPIGLV